MIRGDECKIAASSKLLCLMEENLSCWRCKRLAKPDGGGTECPVWDGEEHMGKA
jgi:hypothetical protein